MAPGQQTTKKKSLSFLPKLGPIRFRFPVRRIRNISFAFAITANLLQPAVSAATLSASNLDLGRGADLVPEMTVTTPTEDQERYEAALPYRDTLSTACSRRFDAESALHMIEQNQPFLEKDYAEVTRKLKTWMPPDTTGVDPSEAALIIEDDLYAKRKIEQDEQQLRAALDAIPEKTRKAEQQHKEAEATIRQMKQMLAPMVQAARQSLEARGLKAHVFDDESFNFIDLAQITNVWSEQSGRSLADLSVDEQAWFARLACSGNTDGVLARLESLPVEYLQDVLPLSMTSDQPTDQALARGQTIADQTHYGPPNLLDLRQLDRLDDEQFSRLLDRVKKLEAAGFSWTGQLHPTIYNDGPAAETDLGKLGRLPYDRPSLRVYIDPPGRMSPLYATCDFASLLEVVEGWTASKPTADLLPFLAVLAQGAENPATQRAEALQGRVSFGNHPNEGRVLARLAAGTFNNRVVDEEALAFLDMARERMGRDLGVNEAAVLLNRHFHGESIDKALPLAAWQRAKKSDPKAGLDDLYIWQLTRTKGKKEQLIKRIGGRIALPQSRMDRAAEYSERFADWAESLSRSDLVRIDWIQKALLNSTTTKAIGEHLAQDLANDNSELGGMFIATGSRKLFVPLTPEQELNNNAFEFPKSVRDPYWTVATVHFHATSDLDNEHNAGPSSAFGGRCADRASAWEMAKSDVVVTHLGPGRFGVDYYTPSGAVVDLGTFTY